MFKRVALVLSLVVLLAGCKDPKPGVMSFTGLGNTVVNDSQIVASNDNNPTLAGNSINYLIVKVTFTNDSNVDMAPTISKFVLTDSYAKRYPAIDQGSVVFTGISNYTGLVKVGEKHDYTIGFRVSGTTLSGTIGYEP